MKVNDKPIEFLRLMRNCVTDYSVIAFMTLLVYGYLFARI
jgi:hypothetical protein